MPVLLDNPFDPKDMDPGKLYTHAEVTTYLIDPNDSRMKIRLEWGVSDGGVWKPGLKIERINWTDDRYNEVVARRQATYNAVKTDLYEELIYFGYIAGTIV